MSNKNDTIFGISIPKFSYSNLKGKYRDSWIEDSFSFEQKSGRQPALSGSKNYIGSSFSIQKKKIFI